MWLTSGWHGTSSIPQNGSGKLGLNSYSYFTYLFKKASKILIYEGLRRLTISFHLQKITQPSLALYQVTLLLRGKVHGHFLHQGSWVTLPVQPLESFLGQFCCCSTRATWMMASCCCNHPVLGMAMFQGVSTCSSCCWRGFKMGQLAVMVPPWWWAARWVGLRSTKEQTAHPSVPATCWFGT